MNTREFINKVIEASETGLNDIYAVTHDDLDNVTYFEVATVRRDDFGNVAIGLVE